MQLIKVNGLRFVTFVLACRILANLAMQESIVGVDWPCNCASKFLVCEGPQIVRGRRGHIRGATVTGPVQVPLVEGGEL